MNILAIETSSDACSCALRLGDGNVIERFEVAPRQHTQRLLPMVHELLAQSGLALGAVDALAYGAGPGSFTGVRIAACAAQGLGLAVDRPVVAVSSLAALALAGLRAHPAVLAVLDARMGEVYLGAYVASGDADLEPRGDEQLGSPAEVPLPSAGRWLGLGSGWSAHGGALARRLRGRLHAVDVERLPGAAEVAALAVARLAAGAGAPAAQAIPGYLRRQVATPRRAK